MRLSKIALTGASGLMAAALIGLGGGVANAAGTGDCTGTGPAASLSTQARDSFQQELAALKAERAEIRAKYDQVAANNRARARAKGRTNATARLTTAQREAKQAALAEWRAQRDALFAKYGLR